MPLCPVTKISRSMVVGDDATPHPAALTTAPTRTLRWVSAPGDVSPTEEPVASLTLIVRIHLPCERVLTRSQIEIRQAASRRSDE